MGESKLKIRRTCTLCGRTMKLTAEELKKHTASCKGRRDDHAMHD